jgi:uncharacterized membrane protein
MNWQEGPNWLKGGIIALFVGLIINLITPLSQYFDIITEFIPKQQSFLANLLMNHSSFSTTPAIWFILLYYLVFIIELAIYWFFTGMVLGLIYGKIKEKFGLKTATVSIIVLIILFIAVIILFQNLFIPDTSVEQVSETQLKEISKLFGNT